MSASRLATYIAIAAGLVTIYFALRDHSSGCSCSSSSGERLQLPEFP